MSAVSKRTTLEHLIIQCVNPRDEATNHCLPVLLGAFPSFKVKEMTLKILPESSNEVQTRILSALKKNYVLQRVQCVSIDRFHEFSDIDQANWFSAANQAALESCLERNRKLARWTEDPTLVPRDLWTYAIDLALKAGVPSLYQSLLALANHSIGLRRPTLESPMKEESRQLKRDETDDEAKA